MTVLTVNRRKNMPACFLHHTISIKRLNAVLEFTLTSSLSSKRNMKKRSFLRNSSIVQASRPLQAFFYKFFKHFQNQRGTKSATMHVKTVGGVRPIFKIYQKTNDTQSQHSITL